MPELCSRVRTGAGLGESERVREELGQSLPLPDRITRSHCRCRIRPVKAQGNRDQEFTGKYENPGRIAAWLLDRFFTACRELLQPRLRPGMQILEIGCGAGYSTERLAQWCPAANLIASDIGESLVSKARTRNPSVPVIVQSVYELAQASASMDAIVMLEVLEHLDRPQAALRELRRICKPDGVVLLSTPREPIWRMLNMARGKYLSAFGNTPGHIQHWSARGLAAEVSTHFRVLAHATPLPWTILLLRPCP